MRTPSAYHNLRLSGFPVSLNKNTNPLIKLKMTQTSKITMMNLSTARALQLGFDPLYQRPVIVE